MTRCESVLLNKINQIGTNFIFLHNINVIKMVDRIDMALDDIIKASKRGRGGGGAGRKFDTSKKTGRGGGGGGAAGGFRNGRAGGVLRGKNRGGVSKPTNYSRVNRITYDCNITKWRTVFLSDAFTNG